MNTTIPADFFDRIIERRDSDSLKWDARFDRNVLPMWVADMDFASPPAVIEALHERISHPIFGYGIAPPELKGTIRERLKEQYNWLVEDEWIVWLPGLVCGLNAACRTAGEAGSSILTHTPIYPPFLTAPGHGGQQTLRSPLIYDGRRWEMDRDQMQASISKSTKALLLCNPHNPTGRSFDAEEIEWITTFCEQNDLLLISDEIHCDFILDQDRRHIPSASISSAAAQRSITLMAPSKTYNIAGLGLSIAVIPNPEIRRRFERVGHDIIPHPNLLAYYAAQAAYRHGQPWLDALIDYLRANRDLLENEVSGIPGLSMPHVESTFLAWINTQESGLANPVKAFEAAGVGLMDGQLFGAPGYARLNFGCPRAHLEQGISCLKAAMT